MRDGTVIKGWNGYKWSNILYWPFEASDETFAVRDATEDVAGRYYKLRLTATNFEGMREIYGTSTVVALDDFRIQTQMPGDNDYVCEDLSVKDTHYTFTGLDPESDYIYYVKARNGEKGIDSGAVTEQMDAFGVAAPREFKTTDIDKRGAFTANWDKAPKATSFLVNRYDIYTAPETEENHIVLEEDFSLVTTTATVKDPVVVNNPTLDRIDEYTHNLGWYGYMYGLAEGAIGSIGLPEYGLGGQIQSPELSLGNNGGDFHVTITACGSTGDYLDIITSVGTGVMFPLSEEYETMEADFHNGRDFDVLAFLSEYKQPFFISYVKVEQKLGKGDKTRTLMEEAYTPEISTYLLSCRNTAARSLSLM